MYIYFLWIISVASLKETFLCWTGMHHQGIFRIPGAQVEINEFKAEFEKGQELNSTVKLPPEF